MRKLWQPLVAWALVLAASGCSAPEPETSPAEAFSPDMSSLLSDARAAQASEAQLALLEQALKEDTLSFEDLNVQFVAGVQCLEDAGYTVVVDPPEEIFGLPHPAMRYRPPAGLSDEQESEISATCDRKHYAFVDSFYVGQPVAIDAYLASFENQREYIFGCLAERGVTVDLDATPTELLYAVSTEQASEAGKTLAPCYQGGVFMGYLP